LLLLLFAVACTQPPDVADVVDVDLPDDYPLDAAPETRGPDLARWVVDFDEALLLSAERSRPVLALYREPAGITDQPLMAEAVEDLFVPLVLPAGNGGCRVFDAAGLDLIPPEETVETPGQLAALMVRALETDGGEAPGWLRLVAEELGDAERRMMTLTMYCYWEGEAKLGNLDGVLATRSGYMGEDEVVEVVYDADRLGFDELVGKAKELDCDDRFYVHTAADYDRARELVGRKAAPAPERAEAIEFTEVKYALRRTPMGRLPLTPLQGTKMNADIRFETDPRRWLSPRQLAMLDDVKQLLAENPNALDDFLPPDQPRQLADYQARLLEKLGIGGIGDR
jgi:hypothetical protein